MDSCRKGIVNFQFSERSVHVGTIIIWIFKQTTSPCAQKDRPSGYAYRGDALASSSYSTTRDEAHSVEKVSTVTKRREKKNHKRATRTIPRPWRWARGNSSARLPLSQRPRAHLYAFTTAGLYIKNHDSFATVGVRDFLKNGCTVSSRFRIGGDVLLTSKKWRLQSGCNHSTAYVDQWKR